MSGHSVAADSCGLQHEFNLDSIKRKYDAAAFCSVQDTGFKQRRDVAMHRLDIATDTPGCLSNGHWRRAIDSRTFSGRHMAPAGELTHCTQPLPFGARLSVRWMPLLPTLTPSLKITMASHRLSRSTSDIASDGCRQS